MRILTNLCSKQKLILTAIFLLGSPAFSVAQQEDLIQLSGFVITEDSSTAIPNATAKIVGEPRGTVANLEGFFSLIVKAKDTVEFSSIGFKPARYVVPEDPKDNKIKLIQPLEYDTLVHEEAVVHPWPTKGEFKEAFLELDLPDNRRTIARKNLQREKLNELSKNLPMDAKENFNLYRQQLHREGFRQGANLSFYNMGGGTPIPGSLLNPFAWAEFIDAIESGDFSGD